ncbi:hypothetical protein AB0E01_05025 [Nocardia vinacea]|uniref:hypothetical protein n=1 Tax=Nocardia vinacea TaxID=96468 RepID=UPI00340897C5
MTSAIEWRTGAFADLDAADTVELLVKAPSLAKAARLTITQISAALERTRRHNIADKAAAIQAALRSQQLGQPEVGAEALHGCVKTGTLYNKASPAQKTSAA